MTELTTRGMGAHIDEVWDESIVPQLFDYIRIPNVSQAYDADWRANGHMTRAVELVRSWCAGRDIAGLTVEVVELPDRSPLILMEVPAFGAAATSRSADDTVVLYGHLDKQPEMSGWREGLGPWTPVMEDGKLYGRGGADDGYAAFASLLAIESAQAAGYPHARLVVMIEASEESGSPDLPAYLEAYADRIGTPSLVLCLDSGCMDDRRLWVTTSLRGLAGGNLRVDVLTEGVHSGEASGVVPSSMRIIRQLLDRIEDSLTGRILLPELWVEIPADRRAEAEQTATEFTIGEHFPFVDDTRPMSADPAEQLLMRTWYPTLSYTAIDGLPPTTSAGNVLRPYTTLHLSFRLPPTCDAAAAQAAVERALTSDPPYGARVTYTGESAPGWNAPSFEPWLSDALAEASELAFGTTSKSFGEGGTIPFMGMLGDKFPDAQFVITGVLGPGSNAHGPNEFLDVPTARKVTRVLAEVLRTHATR
jgi:acetylornithine deacetylase/succinyl-diaminopimelate desuccinylase-like protein